jgi:hypothetical protein
MAAVVQLADRCRLGIFELRRDESNLAVPAMSQSMYSATAVDCGDGLRTTYGPRARIADGGVRTGHGGHRVNDGWNRTPWRR